jgi:conjugal transfer mating pair stabilization protein TraG
MSKLPVDINVGRQIASAQQQMAREADVQAESALHGYNSSVTSAWNSLQQFGTKREQCLNNDRGRYYRVFAGFDGQKQDVECGCC